MKLSALASHYVAYKQAMGMRFHTEARTLRSFCRTMGDITIADIAADRCARLSHRRRPSHELLTPQIRGAPWLLSFCDGSVIRQQLSASQDHSETTAVCPPHLLP